MAGIKESEEALVGVLKLAALLAKRLKDGIDLADAMEIYKVLKDDPDYLAAVEGIGKVPEELKDLDVQEVIELAGKVLVHIPKLIDAMK